MNLNFLPSILPNNLLPYCILGLATMLEGPISLLAGGAAISSGLLLPVPVYLSVVTGNLTGDMCWYGLGRFAKMEWILRLCPRFRIDPQKIVDLRNGIQKHAPRLLFLTKLTVGFPIPTLIATGLSRVPIRRWIGMLILGELIKSAAFVAAGYAYGSAIQRASSEIQAVLWGITAVMVIAGMVWSRRHKKSNA
jgi:membrane protein DedA with SNARE-associated domain